MKISRFNENNEGGRIFIAINKPVGNSASYAETLFYAFKNIEDGENHILNHINDYIQAFGYDEYDEELEENAIKDSDGNYIFIDFENALKWYNTNCDEDYWEYELVELVTEKVELNSRIKIAREINKYNL